MKRILKILKFDTAEQVGRTTTSFIFSVISYRFLWNSTDNIKNLKVGIYFYVSSIVIGLIWRKIYKRIQSAHGINYQTLTRFEGIKRYKKLEQ